MNDSRDPRDQPADGELLSAYLDGDLDDAASAALESRLEREPALAEQLERTREVIEALAGVTVEVPDGYAQRLQERLAAERGAPGHASAATVTSLGDRRPASRVGSTGPGRGGRGRRWNAGLTAAAGVVAVALIGGVAVLGGGLRGAHDETTASGTAEVDTADEDAPARLFADEADDATAFDLPEDGQEAEAQPEEGAGALAPAAGQPVVLDAGAVLDGDEAAGDHLSAAAATAAPGVLGLPLAEAEDVGAAFRVALQRAEPFDSGVRPDRCLEEVTAGVAGAAVPVHVEALTFEGQDALAYLVVTATGGADVLDRVEGWVVEPGACATRLFRPVTP